MAQFTLVTRLADGFLLMESNEPLHGSTTIKDQAKAIARRLEPHSPTRLSIDCGPHQISYLLEDGLCFLVVTDTAYPRRLTFSYLASVHREFTAYLRDVDGEGWKNALSVTSRAYAHQGFAGSKLPQLRREYADPQSKSNASRLSEELQDVHSIMRKNIAEVLQRGENLDRECGGVVLAVFPFSFSFFIIVCACSFLSLTHTHTHTGRAYLPSP
jgi:vesicle transport protein SEC22